MYNIYGPLFSLSFYKEIENKLLFYLVLLKFPDPIYNESNRNFLNPIQTTVIVLRTDIFTESMFIT